MSQKIAIIAALERELRPLVKDWQRTTAAYDNHQLTFHESSYAVAVAGGIGAEPARRTAEALIARCSPGLLISAGVAGALVPDLRVGDTIFPALLIDTTDSSRRETAIGGARMASSPLARTVLATYPEVATVAQKQQLAKSYGAHAVDMEAAAVAVVAEKHGIPFLAIKAISDDLGFELRGMNQYIGGGEFRTAKFAFHVAIRPWLWPRVYRLARNTKLACENLCAWLRESALTNTIVPEGLARAETPAPPQSGLR